MKKKETEKNDLHLVLSETSMPFISGFGNGQDSSNPDVLDSLMHSVMVW